MDLSQLKYHLQDLGCLRLFHKRRKIPKDCDWHIIMRAYGNQLKRIRSTDWRWYVITYHDGGRELMYLKVRQGGILSGLYPAIYRGILIPKMIGYDEYATIKDFRLAF